MSNKWSLNQVDWEKWSLNFVRFCALPTAIAFLTALQGGMDIKIAWGVAMGTLYSSAIDLFRKFIAGEPENKIEPSQPTV